MLESYYLVYHVVILPDIIIYSQLTLANNYIYFDKELIIPIDYKSYPIDCFFTIYSKEGNLVLASHEQTSFLSLKAVINSIPLKMIKDLVITLKES